MSHRMIRRILEGARKVEDSELQLHATEPPGAMAEEDETLTVEEVGRMCPECAQSMKERGVTGVKLGPAMESGIFELAADDDEEGVLFEREGKDGWPKKLKTGRFTSYCKSQGFAGPSVACAKKAMDSGDESVRGMASFYMNTVQPGGKTASAVKGKEECAPGPEDEVEEEAVDEKCGRPGKKAKKAAGKSYSKTKEPKKFWGTAQKIQKAMD